MLLLRYYLLWKKRLRQHLNLNLNCCMPPIHTTHAVAPGPALHCTGAAGDREETLLAFGGHPRGA